MALEAKFTVTTTTLRFQEDSVCTFKVTNTGRDPVPVVDAGMMPHDIRLRTVNVKTGAERIYKHIPPGGSLPSDEPPLAPGRSIQIGAMLLDLPRELEPGEYDISMACPYARETALAESPPVRVKIRGTTPRNLTIEGTGAMVLFGTWVNVAEDPPEIVRSQFNVLPGGRARDFRPLAKATLAAAPLLSVPANRTVCRHHYVAWRDKGEIRFFHHHETLGTSPVRSIRLPDVEVRIAAPLHSDPPPDNGGRPAGAFLIWMADSGKGDPQLQAVKLTEAGATAQARSPLPGPKPAFLGSFARSDGRRMALVVQATAGSVSLSLVPWPGVSGSSKKLGEWKGEFVDLGYSMEYSDVLHGSILVRAGVEAHNDLERVDFDLDPKDAFEAKAAVRLSNDPKDPVQRAIVRVSGRGAVVALLRAASGTWSLYDGDAVSPLPGSIRTTEFPLDVCFQDDRTPILLVGAKDLGIRALTTSGEPLPEGH